MLFSRHLSMIFFLLLNCVGLLQSWSKHEDLKIGQIWDLYLTVPLCVSVSVRRLADGPDRHLIWTLRRGCGLSGGIGLNALRPVAWASHRGAGSVYLLHLPGALPCLTLHQIGRVTCQEALETQLSHLCAPSTLQITLSHTHLIIRLLYPPVTMQDCHCTGILTLGEEELLYQDRRFHPRLFVSQSSPQPIKNMYLYSDPTTALPHTATASQLE